MSRRYTLKILNKKGVNKKRLLFSSSNRTDREGRSKLALPGNAHHPSTAREAQNSPEMDQKITNKVKNLYFILNT